MTAGIDKFFPSIMTDRFPVLDVFECQERKMLARVVKRPLEHSVRKGRNR